MKKFFTDQEVQIIVNNELKTGIIDNSFPEIEKAIVKVINDDETTTVYKRSFEDIILVSENDDRPEESNGIFITEDEFQNVAIDLIFNEFKDNPLIGAVLVMLCTILQRRLFLEND